LTKRDLIKYLVRASSFILPHLLDRPITLSRYPDGIGGEHFWQRHWNHPVPDFVQTVPLSEHGGAERDYLLCNNLASLVWLGQQANIDLHAWFSRISPEPVLRTSAKNSADFFSRYPDFIIFDIDPYIYSGKEAKGAEPELNREAFKKTCEVALRLKEALDELSSIHSLRPPAVPGCMSTCP
jgi:bifunctional non-homologous end joining protein LigD